jgi:hypothetical protein
MKTLIKFSLLLASLLVVLPSNQMQAHHSIIIPQDILALFVQRNFQFMTQAPGRPATLYFEDARGNMGRLRQGHDGGPTLVYARAGIHPHRVFFSQELVNALEATPGDTPDLVEAASLFPAIGERVFEYFGNWNPHQELYQRQHGSSGLIVQIGGQMPPFNINHYQNVITRW